MDDTDNRAADALNTIIRELNSLDDSTRRRILSSVLSFFHVNADIGTSHLGFEPITSVPKSPRPEFSKDNFPTPKEFLAQKQPKTDVERIACLAYYLTHFRAMPYFKTSDLAALNTEAAQPKFSNTTYSSTNAANQGYLAPASKGQRQISAAGEQYVVALPDREAAKEAMTTARRRKNTRRKK